MSGKPYRLGRFRCNIFNQRGTVGLVLRVIPRKIYTIDDLMLPKVLKTICQEQRGLVLVTGTTGSGKSTTLAAMIDLINATRTEHILTIEDPIEYLHRDNLSIVNQREVEADCKTFSTAGTRPWPSDRGTRRWEMTPLSTAASCRRICFWWWGGKTEMMRLMVSVASRV